MPHTFRANIESGIEHVCNISNGNFQKFPKLAFEAGNLLTILFSAESRQFDWYNVETRFCESCDI